MVVGGGDGVLGDGNVGGRDPGMGGWRWRSRGCRCRGG